MNAGYEPTLPMYRPTQGSYGTNKELIEQAEGMPTGPELAAYYGLKPYRPSINLGAVILASTVPWFIFVVTFSALSFSIRYYYPEQSYAIVGMVIAGVVFLGVSAVNVIRKSRMGGDEPSWSVFIFIAGLIALFVGGAAGQWNFYVNMRPYFDLSSLNSYPSVDPAAWDGQSFMDAGKIEFVPGSKLDLSKNMAFLNGDMYCIVPIVGPSGTSLKHDFWAVGVNCCTTQQYDYKCGEYNNVRAHSGLRLMKDTPRAWYRLALKQAEATYNIKTNHPMFFYWMENPDEEVAAYKDMGTRGLILGSACYFGINLFLVLIAMCAFAKMGRL